MDRIWSPTLINSAYFSPQIVPTNSLYFLKNKPIEMLTETPIENPEYFFIKCDNKHERILKSDILYVQALENYVQIVTQQGKFMTLLPLKTVEKYLENDRFIKTHKSFLVSIDKIETLESYEVRIQHFTIPISRNFKEGVLKMF
jgi:DNA-binding LytR/AlgR family response regulator